jgi:hypothetical protein
VARQTGSVPGVVLAGVETGGALGVGPFPGLQHLEDVGHLGLLPRLVLLEVAHLAFLATDVGVVSGDRQRKSGGGEQGEEADDRDDSVFHVEAPEPRRIPT